MMPRENRQVAWRAHYLHAKTVERTERRSWARVGSRSGPFIPARALLVCAAYYVGANIGFILRFPSATPSVMWPPNAILTATLLLTPPRRWWVYLLAALPAHLVAEGLGAGWPAPLVLGLFATNCSEALVAAALVGVGVATLIDPIAGPPPGSPHPQMSFPLPFLLWASVRFGPGGASLSILTTTLIAIFADTHRRGPFGDLPLAESLLALQIFLSAVAIPFLCLAALMEERRRTQETLEERLRFHELLSGLLPALLPLPVDAIDDPV